MQWEQIYAFLDKRALQARQAETELLLHTLRVGQNHIYIQFIYGILGREITKYTVIYNVYIGFWPTYSYLHLAACLARCV